VSGVDRTRVAAYALCWDEAGRVLLCHLAPSVGVGDLWTLPGGGIDFGEAPGDAVLRELMEETSLTGRLGRLLDVGDRLFGADATGDRLHAIRIVYEVDDLQGTLTRERHGTTDACRWVTREEASRMPLGEFARRALRLTSTDA